jgi:hypothetical protein
MGHAPRVPLPGGSPVVRSRFPNPGKTARLRGFLLIFLISGLLAACGGGDDGAQVEWIEGTPPPEFIAQVLDGGESQPPTSAPTPTMTPDGETPDSEPTAATTPTAPEQPTATATTAAPPEEAVSGGRLTDEQLAQYQPNELGAIPVLEYHVFTTDSDEEAQFTRTIDDFRSDLEWLYENGFYVVPMKDVVQNQIAAPAGKKPVVLTFDDSTAGQFRFLFGENDSVTIDPDSAVGVMETFYAEHPDFGRGGFFGVLPKDSLCFAWQLEVPEEDQYGYCGQKLTWLLDNGYEIGNHTLNHTDLLDLDDDKFQEEVGGAIDALQAYDSRIEANILVMPFGNYPDSETRQNQREWLRNGFTWNGKDYRIIACLMVGSNPTESPNSTEFDSMWIARIQAFDDDAGVKDSEGNPETTIEDWFDLFADDPGRLFVSDGDPNIVTVPEDLPASTIGSLDTDRLESQGKELVRY